MTVREKRHTTVKICQIKFWKYITITNYYGKTHINRERQKFCVTSIESQLPKERHIKIEIDIEQFAKDIKAGKGIGGSDGALGDLIKQLTKAALAAERCSRYPHSVSQWT